MSEDPAKRRYMIIQAARWIGLALTLAGLLALYGKDVLPRDLGYALVPLGLACALIVPSALARRWRTPRQ